MSQAQTLTKALNALASGTQFTYQKARSAARADGNVDWTRTKAANDDFNPEVDGCESFVMKDGSTAAWMPASQRYAAR